MAVFQWIVIVQLFYSLSSKHQGRQRKWCVRLRHQVLMTASFEVDPICDEHRTGHCIGMPWLTWGATGQSLYSSKISSSCRKKLIIFARLSVINFIPITTITGTARFLLARARSEDPHALLLNPRSWFSHPPRAMHAVLETCQLCGTGLCAGQAYKCTKSQS